jgi:signal transduction histidine kinase
MLTQIKIAPQLPWIARYTWVAMMLFTTLFAANWGMAYQQMLTLFAVSVLYGVVVVFAHTQQRVLFKHYMEHHAWLAFVIDLMAWSVFIYYSGGASNPLTTLFLTVAGVAAIVLPTKQSLGLSLLAIMAYIGLWYFYQPLQLNMNREAYERLHLLGMFGVFVVALLMMTLITIYFKQTMSRGYQALEQAQQSMHQQRRLLAVSSLAANVAHEMSTPIASIQLLTDDIAAQLDPDDELLEDIRLLQSQIRVCGQSLASLKNHIHANEHDTHDNDASSMMTHKVTDLAEILPRVISEWLFLNSHMQVILPPDLANHNHGAIWVQIDEEQFTAILTNILNNAMQAQATQIDISVSIDQLVRLVIDDNGAGIPATTIAKLAQQTALSSANGWGFGLTLAKTVLENVGGQLMITPLSNDTASLISKNTHPATGTRVIITLIATQPKEENSPSRNIIVK